MITNIPDHWQTKGTKYVRNDGAYIECENVIIYANTAKNNPYWRTWKSSTWIAYRNNNHHLCFDFNSPELAIEALDREYPI